MAFYDACRVLAADAVYDNITQKAWSEWIDRSVRELNDEVTQQG